MANESMAEYLRENGERYEQIRHLADHVERTGSAYAHTSYRVRLDGETRELTDRDLLVLCDRGNACFGGNVSRRGEYAEVVIYTD